MTSTPSSCKARASWLSSSQGERHSPGRRNDCRNGIDDGHRAGQGEFQVVRGMGAGGAGLEGVNSALEPQRPPPAAPSPCSGPCGFHLDLVGEVDAFDVLRKP